MLEFVIHQLRQSFALTAVQFGPLVAGQGTEAGEIPDAGAHLEKLESKSLMLDAASDRGVRFDHGAPVENLQERGYARGEQKANTILRFVFAVEFQVESQKFKVKKPLGYSFMVGFLVWQPRT